MFKKIAEYTKHIILYLILIAMAILTVKMATKNF